MRRFHRRETARLEPNDGRTFYWTEEWFHSEPWSQDGGAHLGQPPTRTSCDDPLAGGGDLVEVLGRRYRDAGIDDVTVTVYPGGRHEILNETNRDEVTAELIGWLAEHL